MTNTTPREPARRWPALLTSAGTVAAAVLVPKCPLCVVAALSALGIGVGMTAAGLFVMLVRPVAAVVAIGAVAMTVWPLVHRHTRRVPEVSGPHGDCPACCGRSERRRGG